MNIDIPADSVIAVVDDDVHISHALGEWLNLIGIRGSFHTVAENLLTALESHNDYLQINLDISHQHRYRLIGVIIDINLPDMTGIQLSQKLRHLQADLPIVLISALREEERSRYGELPANVACMKKPFDLDTLEAALFDQMSKSTAGDQPCLT